MKRHFTILLIAFCLWVICLNLVPLISHIVPLRAGFIHPYFPWANFDGVHYLDIAKNGYTTNMRFMPLYPILIHLVGFQTDFILTTFVVSNIIFLLALFYLYKLFNLDYLPTKSFILAIGMLFLPTSFFYSAVYTEGLFLLLTVLAVYSARKRRWLLAALCGFFASLTRIVGFLIVIPLLIEYFSQNKKKVHHLFALSIIPVGTMLYALYNYMKWGNPLLFIQAHSQLSNGRTSTSFVLFPQTLYRYYKILTTVSVSLWEWKIALLELLFFCLAAIGTYYLWKQKVRLSYVVYTALSLLIPASSGTFSGLPRYTLVLFPLLIIFLGIRRRIVLIIIMTISFILQLTLLLYFWRGYFVA